LPVQLLNGFGTAWLILNTIVNRFSSYTDFKKIPNLCVCTSHF
jgi:hypothetical protein